MSTARRLPKLEVGLLALAVAGISASAPLAAAAAAPALAIAFWRNAMACGVLIGQASVTSRTRVQPRDIVSCALAGVFLAFHFGLWIPSLQLTSVAASTALVCTAPLWSGLLSRITGHQVTARQWIGIAVAFCGVLLISGFDVTASPDALLGDLLALAGGACMALYLATGERAQRRLDTVSYTLLCYGTAALALLVVCLFSGSALFGYGAATWGILAALTVCGQLLGHSLLNRALRWLPSSTIALLTLLEVPGAALLAAALLGQLPGIAIWLGIAVILMGLWLTVRASRSDATAAAA